MKKYARQVIGLTIFILFIATFSVQANDLLFSAVANNDLAGVKDQLAKGADPNYGTDQDLPVLLVAVLSETEPAIVEALLRAGANPAWTDEDGETVLTYAIFAERPVSIFDVLIKGGVPANARNEDNFTLLHIAVIMESGKDIYELFLDAGVNINLQADEGYTALSLAIVLGLEADIIDFFLRRGANPNLQTVADLNPLLLAIEAHEDEKVIHLLLDAGANVTNIAAEVERASQARPGFLRTQAYQRIQTALKPEPALPSLAFGFPEVLVPGGTGFPTGVFDKITDEVIAPFYLGAHEVTYKVWKEVYDWAVSPERGDKRYYFWHEGNMGRSPTGDTTPDHPVASLIWFDAVNWCNALTEYYNLQNGTKLEPVYYNKGVHVRDSRQSSIYQTIHNVEAKPGATGFRLPTTLEWDLAARYVDGKNWTPGDYVSGGAQMQTPEIGDYAWYYDNSNKSTHPVGQKLPNALGIYDMSGNVSEFCFDFYPLHDNDDRIIRSGNYYDNYGNLQLGRESWAWPAEKISSHGMRVARTP